MASLSLSDYAVASTPTRSRKLKGTLSGCAYLSTSCRDFSEIAGLFTDLRDRLERGRPVECIEEIVNAAFDGRIDLDAPFNLSGYEYKVLHNEERNKTQKAKKGKFKPAFVGIDFMPSDEDGAAQGCMGIDQVSYAYYEQQKNAEDSIADIRDVELAVEYFHLVRSEFMVYENCDIIALLKSALTSSEAVSRLSVLKDKYKKFGENMKILLTSGKSLNELFPDG